MVRNYSQKFSFKRSSIVSSIHVGISEAIIDGETGFLTQEKDEKAIAQSILMLFQNAQIREQFANSGRTQVEQKFNLKRNIA